MCSAHPGIVARGISSPSHSVHRATAANGEEGGRESRRLDKQKVTMKKKKELQNERKRGGELREEADTRFLGHRQHGLPTLTKGEEFSHPLPGLPHAIQFTKQPEGTDELHMVLIVIGRLGYLGGGEEGGGGGGKIQREFIKKVLLHNGATEASRYKCNTK